MADFRFRREKINRDAILGVTIGIAIVTIMLAGIILLFSPSEVDPLGFSIRNKDVHDHEVSVEIFDPENNSIFKESYLLAPEERISSPDTPVELGTYRYEITLDNKITKTQYARSDYVFDLSSSEFVDIEIVEDQNEPIHIGISVA